MAYNIDMNKNLIPQVIVETTPYIKAVDAIWDKDMQIEFKNFIGINYMQGDVIPGTGGLRKIRWQSNGHGKRGGARIIYYFYNANQPIYLLFAYPKNVQVNLTEHEKKLFSNAVSQLKEALRKKEAENNGR